VIDSAEKVLQLPRKTPSILEHRSSVHATSLAG
jgi:hypothetical protein